MSPKSTLVPTLPPEREAMRAAFAQVLCSDCGWAHANQDFFLLADGEFSALGIATGVACVCREDDCTGRWPTFFIPSMDTPANPFECWGMIRREGRWQVLVNAIN